MINKIGTPSDNWNKEKFNKNTKQYLECLSNYNQEKKNIKLGGGVVAIEKQHDKKRLTARERIDYLIDKDSKFFELGIYGAWDMYKEYGTPNAAGTIIGITAEL